MRILLLLALAACMTPVLAEQADRDQPTIIEADRGVFDELKQVNVVTGRVTMTKGTIRITGERMEMRTSPEGYRSATVTAAPDSLATFRQRRDARQPGIEEYIDGVAEQIEWDEKADTVRFVRRAEFKRLENGVVRDEVSGQVITYDATNATYRVDGGERSEGRVRAVIAPRTGGGQKPGAGSTPAAESPPARK